jgi:hypothetical protein
LNGADLRAEQNVGRRKFGDDFVLADGSGEPVERNRDADGAVRRVAAAGDVIGKTEFFGELRHEVIVATSDGQNILVRNFQFWRETENNAINLFCPFGCNFGSGEYFEPQDFQTGFTNQ